MRVLIVCRSDKKNRKIKSLIGDLALNLTVLDFAKSYADFARKVSENIYDLFVIDEVIEGDCGLNLLRLIEPKLAEPIVVFLTEDEFLSEQAIQLGAQDCVGWNELQPRTLRRLVINSLARQSLAKQGVERERILRLSNEKLEKDSQAKSELLTFLSHEIRTPLTILFGCTELLAESPLSARQKKHMQSLQTARHHILELVNDMLDPSKIAVEGYVAVVESFLMAELVKDVTSIVEPACNQKGLVFAFDSCLSPDAVVCSDKRGLVHILTNLTSNSLKFTTAGSIRVQVESVSQNIERLRFTVTDTGVGMTAAAAGQFLDRSAVSQRTSLCEQRGAGVGLYISQKIVEQLGGTLKVSTKTGLGSCFFFEIDNLSPQSQVGANRP